MVSEVSAAYGEVDTLSSGAYSRPAARRTARSRPSVAATTPPPFAEVADLPLKVTVIVPTFNEREAVGPTLERLDRVLASQSYRSEILVVDDDSPDGTADLVRGLRTRVRCRVLVRKGERGLASAIQAGFAGAQTPVAVVMDADGSHPPEMVPALIAPILGGRADMALASRYIPGGNAKGWPQGRRVISRVATAMARPLTPVRDPMTGFFALDLKLLERAQLRPIGYKMALEILVRCRPDRVVEVPFTFRNRLAGRSKLGRGEVLRYARHLSRLYVARRPRAARAA